MARSPSARRLGGSADDLLLGELLEIVPADVAGDLVCGGEDRPAVARMRLDDLSHPLRIEEVLVAFRSVLLLHQLRVVADDAQPGAPGREEAVRILLVLRVVERDVLGDVGREHPFALPDYEVGRVGAVHHVDLVEVAAVLLADALEDALAARPLDPQGHPRILRLEGLAEALGDGKVDGGVPDRLPFLLRGFDQSGRHLARGRRGAERLAPEERQRERRRGETLQDLAPRQSVCSHGRVPSQETSARQCSLGNVTQTDVPGAKLCSGAAMMRNCEPPFASTT